MEYCKRCVYPKNTQPTIQFDDEGICSSCRTHEGKYEIDWDERQKELEPILEEYKAKRSERESNYDCIVPVSGGKDSTYQVYLISEVYGLNPLLVTYNHNFNTKIGLRNLRNMVKQFDCDLIRVTSKHETVKKLSRYMLKKVGDLTWHYHTGIFTVPFQVAVNYNIPLVIWGEHAWSETTGVVNLKDNPEFTKWMRDEYSMRGVSVEEIVEEVDDIDESDLVPYTFPDYEKFRELGVRGIYLGNHYAWKHLEQVKFLCENYDYKVCQEERDRTFCQFKKMEDHANDIHDYLRYLKYGYGRGTQHACEEIRMGRMTREQGIEMAEKYDPARPSTLDAYLDFMEMSEAEFEEAIAPMRDESIWKQNEQGDWVRKDSVANHKDDPGVEEARVDLVDPEDRAFGDNNKHYFYSDNFEPLPEPDNSYVTESVPEEFTIL